jgi:hypothetical protein
MQNDFGNPGVSVDRVDPSDITQVVSVVIGNYLIQLSAKQSDLYHRQDVNKGKISQIPEMYQFYYYTNKKILLPDTFDGPIQKHKASHYWSADPMRFTPVPLHTMNRNRFALI